MKAEYELMCERMRAEAAMVSKAGASRDAEESVESRAVGGKRPPGAPGEADWREHRQTHWPFRSWCLVCVAARSTETRIVFLGHRLSPMGRKSIGSIVS